MVAHALVQSATNSWIMRCRVSQSWGWPKSVPVCPYNRWTFSATLMLRGLLQVQPALRARALGSSPERFVCEL